MTPFLSAHHLFPIFLYIKLWKTSDIFRNGPNSTRTLVFPLPGFNSMNTQPLVFYLSPINSLTLITLKQIPSTISFHPQTFRDVSVRILKKQNKTNEYYYYTKDGERSSLKSLHLPFLRIFFFFYRLFKMRSQIRSTCWICSLAAFNLACLLSWASAHMHTQRHTPPSPGVSVARAPGHLF